MGLITGPAVSNYHVTFWTHFNNTLAALPILWSCVLIMHNNRIEFNNKRGFCFLISLSLKTTLQFTLFWGLRQNTTSASTKTAEITNQTSSCGSAKPNLLNITVGEEVQEEAFPFWDNTVSKGGEALKQRRPVKCVPWNPHVPLSVKLQGVWGWVQARLTPSLHALAPRRRQHSDKHTPTLTCRAAY